MGSLSSYFLALWLLSTLNLVEAQRWALFCDSLDQFVLSRSFKEAVGVGKTALQVLADHGGDDEVKKIISRVVGDSEVEFQYAKAAIQGVSQYDEQASNIGQSEDIYVACFGDGRFVEGEQRDDGSYYDGHLGGWVPSLTKAQLDECLDPHARPSGHNIPMAITNRVSTLDEQAYQAAVNSWSPGTPFPEAKQFLAPGPGFSAIISVCQHFLQGWGLGAPRFDHMMLSSLSRKQSSEPKVDTLVHHPTAVIFHELTHTPLGGLLKDTPEGRCYRWNNAAGGRATGRNAETATIMALGLWAWEQGYTFSDSGDILDR